MKPVTLTMSSLNKTWIFDFDGTLVVHNGYKEGEDQFLPGAEEFLKAIPEDDYILILSAREEEARKKTEDFLKRHNVRYNQLILQIPMGERILFNDSKPSGLKMSYSVECQRNYGLHDVAVQIDEAL